MKFKRFLNKIFTVFAVILITQIGVLAAKMPDMTVPHQYPEKYTPEYIKQITPNYKDVGKDEVFYVALDMLKDTEGMFSRNAILGNNLSQRPIKIERIKKDLTQAMLADIMDVSQNYIASIETGKENMSLGKVLELSKHLKTDINNLLDF